MKFDIFLSICQTEVDGYMPSEYVMWENFFDQVKLADELGFGTAWVAETHLSCEIQKRTPNAVIPHFKGEIGLNTDILQLAHLVFARTRRINIGSAIRNILCNGGPIAHAEAVKTFLALHGHNKNETRKLDLGFAAGRFDFSNVPYGIVPRTGVEKAAWPVVKGKVFSEAAEIFLRLLNGETLKSEQVTPVTLKRSDFRTDADWEKTIKAYGEEGGFTDTNEITIQNRWNFPEVGVIPLDGRQELLRLTIGTHDAGTQIMANRYRPVGVFNLSITPPAVVEETHRRMAQHYHPNGGSWKREYMPRTAMVFIDDSPKSSEEARNQNAKQMAARAWETYWKAMEGTIDNKKVQDAVGNTISGSPSEVARLIKEKYHPEDRLMLWFDFNSHDNDYIKNSMRSFMEKVAPTLVR